MVRWALNWFDIKFFIKSSYIFLITQLPSHRAHFTKTLWKFTKNLTLCFHLWHSLSSLLCVLGVEWSQLLQDTPYKKIECNQSDYLIHTICKKSVGSFKKVVGCWKKLYHLHPFLAFGSADSLNECTQISKCTQNIARSTHNFNTQPLKICFV